MQKKIMLTVLIFFLIIFTSCTESTNRNVTDTAGQTKSKINSGGEIKLNKNIYDLSVKTMEGQDKKLSDYKGKLLLIVNVASQCGYTSQYKGLEEIYEKYKDRGFEILAFPCNDFGGQEPGTNEEIRTFCETKFNVTFSLFDKIIVTGDDKNMLYKRLTENSEPPGEVDWNFEKFIIDKNGNIVARFKSKIKPESEEITKLIESGL